MAAGVEQRIEGRHPHGHERIEPLTALFVAGMLLTLLAFVVKACVGALKRFPEFNASLDGEQLVLKNYFHIGFAADTPNGLVVPVLRDADRALQQAKREGKDRLVVFRPEMRAQG